MVSRDERQRHQVGFEFGEVVLLLLQQLLVPTLLLFDQPALGAAVHRRNGRRRQPQCHVPVE